MNVTITTWGIYCDIQENHSVMTVQIGFSHSESASDETEFCINAWDKQELSELFSSFCSENGFDCVSVQYVSIVRSASTLDELTAIEEQLHI